MQKPLFVEEMQGVAELNGHAEKLGHAERLVSLEQRRERLWAVGERFDVAPADDIVRRFHNVKEKALLFFHAQMQHIDQAGMLAGNGRKLFDSFEFALERFFGIKVL